MAKKMEKKERNGMNINKCNVFFMLVHLFSWVFGWNNAFRFAFEFAFVVFRWIYDSRVLVSKEHENVKSGFFCA